MQNAPAILALIAAAAGWYYLFNSAAAEKLDGIESSVANRNRSRLRRLNGAAMLPLALSFYAGFKIEPHAHPLRFLIIWVIVLILVVVVLALAVADLRLTARLRRKS